MSTGSSGFTQKTRTLIRWRAAHRCERCGVPSPNGQAHHRRSRRVVGPHRHCVCNGMWLCRTCHTQVHGNVNQSRKEGWIVSQWAKQPAEIPVTTTWGKRFHDCDGHYQFA